TPYMFFFVFFFQAEDGIRDGHVTGVQTCALPISPPAQSWPSNRRRTACAFASFCLLSEAAILHLRGLSKFWGALHTILFYLVSRSEERRVGKECRSRLLADH